MSQNIKDTIAIMKLAGSIFTRSAQELEEQLKKLDDARAELPPEVLVPEVIEEKKTRTRAKKEVKADVAPVVEVKEEVAPVVEVPKTVDDLKEAFRNFAKVHGPQAAVTKLSSLGFDRLTSIPDDKIETILAAFTA